VRVRGGEREAARLAALDRLEAARSEVDPVLQEIVEEVRGIFDVDLCMVNLIFSDMQYFRAWAGELPAELAEARQDAHERSMCRYVIDTEAPLVVEDFLATEEFKEQYVCVNYGIRFYAGTPLVTSEGTTVGTLCLLSGRAREVGEEQMTLLRAYARAVVTRLELLGALGRERAAREEEARRGRHVADILESITDAFFALDRRWRFTYVNREAERLLSRSREDLIGRDVWEQFPRAAGSTFHTEYRRALEEGVTVGFEERFVPLGRWFAVRAYPSEVGLSVYFRDVTERKRAEEALREREEFVRQLLCNFPNGSVNVFDRDLRYVLAEGGGLEDEGLSPEMLVGKTLDELFPKESADLVKPYYEKAFAGEGVEFELPLGGRVYGIHAAPLREVDGEVRTIIAVAQNVTERKRAEERLRLRDRAIAASTSGIVITDPNRPENPLIYVNPEFEKLSGYPVEEVLGNNCRFLQGEDRDQPDLDVLRAALREGRECRVVLRNYKKDGTLFWNELTVSPVRDEEGRLKNFIGVQNDVTGRVRAEEALRRSEELYRLLAENSTDLISKHDGAGAFTYASPACRPLLGYEPEELVGSSVFDLIHPEDLRVVRGTHAISPEPAQVRTVEYRVRRKDGSHAWLESTSRTIRGPATEVVAVSRDITERKRAESERARLLMGERAARAEAESTRGRLKTILDNLSEGVMVAEPEGRLVFANPAARAMLGATVGETLERLPDPWEDLSLPEAVARSARDGEGIEARTRHGESQLRVRLERIPSADEGRHDVLVVVQDLSEGQRLEASQQRFLANAAHQLKTPTMAVIGAAELLATGEDADPAIRRRLLNHIFTEGRRMQKLADALLRLARVGWDAREPNLEVLDLGAECRRAAGLMQPLVDSAGLGLHVETGEAGRVLADPEWLQEVLLVLLSNAVKYSSRGGEVRLRARDGAVVVEDEGIGISPADLPHVFERFYRGKGSAEGFGLGLPILKELVERMGGGVSIRSREGIGTSVEVELPEA
jgi:PAS domain S-box-containing protein